MVTTVNQPAPTCQTVLFKTIMAKLQVAAEVVYQFTLKAAY